MTEIQYFSVEIIVSNETSVFPEHTTNKCSVISKKSPKTINFVTRKIHNSNTEFSLDKAVEKTADILTLYSIPGWSILTSTLP